MDGVRREVSEFRGNLDCRLPSMSNVLANALTRRVTPEHAQLQTHASG